VVMLDIGGFSLASMADQARQQGNERAARRAARTGWFLIGVTILTLLLVSIGLLWPHTPAIQDFTGKAEKGLILVRVIMTVIYGHVIHSLRRATTTRQHTTFTEQFTKLSEHLTETQTFAIPTSSARRVNRASPSRPPILAKCGKRS